MMNIFLEKWPIFLSNISIVLICGIVGFFLIMKKMSSLADGLGHSFFGINAIALLLGLNSTFLYFSLLPIILIFLMKKGDSSQSYGDSIVISLSTFFMSLGLLVYNIKPDLKEKINKIFFGNILNIDIKSCFVLIFFSIITLLIVFFYYETLKAYVFSESSFSRKKRIWLRILFIGYSTFLISLCTKYSGSLLTSGMTVFPGIISQNLARNFKQALWISIIIPLIVSFVGIYFVSLYNINPAVINILLAGLIFFISNFFSKNK